MSINLSQLKQKEIRKEFNFEGEKILVKNPNSESKIRIKERLAGFVVLDNDFSIDVQDADMIRFIFSELVDGIVFDELSEEEIVNIFENKTEILQDIMFEISGIMEFIVKEMVFDFTNKINTIDNLLEQKKADEIVNNLSKKHNLPIDIPNYKEKEDKIQNKTSVKTKKKKSE